MKSIHRMAPDVRAALLVPVAIAGAAVAVLLAPALPAHAESAALTIGQLEATGFDVKIDRIGSAPLDECTVTSVRNPQEQTRLVRIDGPGRRDRLVPIVVNRTISVSLDCSR
jgi:hypothetical protein